MMLKDESEGRVDQQRSRIAFYKPHLALLSYTDQRMRIVSGATT